MSDQRDDNGLVSADARFNILGLEIDMVRFDMLDRHERLWVLAMEVLLATFGGVIALGGVLAYGGLMERATFWNWVANLGEWGFVLLALVSFLIYATAWIVNTLLPWSADLLAGIESIYGRTKTDE